jgi:hypothetical protein
LTTPKKIRVMSYRELGQIVSIIPVGDLAIITPKQLELEDARREINRIIKETGISPREAFIALILSNREASHAKDKVAVPGSID